MSNHVEQIQAALNGEISMVLPTYKELCHIYDIAKNNLNTNGERYGVKVGAVTSATGVTKASTVDHTFNIILTQCFGKDGESDVKIRAAINELHDKMDEILASIYNKKAGLPQIVLLVDLDSIDDPEILKEDNVVAIAMNINVKYRRSL